MGHELVRIGFTGPRAGRFTALHKDALGLALDEAYDWSVSDLELARCRVVPDLFPTGPSEPVEYQPILVHGGANGWDLFAHLEVRQSYRSFRVPWRTEIYPSHSVKDSSRLAHDTADILHAPMDPLVRNQVIVTRSKVLVAAVEEPETLRSGTWSTIRYARRSRKRVLIVTPDGRRTWHGEG